MKCIPNSKYELHNSTRKRKKHAKLLLHMEMIQGKQFDGCTTTSSRAGAEVTLSIRIGIGIRITIAPSM